jgi:cupin 2 domain-containing protein
VTNATGNLFADLPAARADEEFTELLSAPNVHIERIVSLGHASPPGFWYDQDWAEWVLLIAGEAELELEGEAAPRKLKPGDHLRIPAHARHRVARTHGQQPTIWLAVHYR